MPTTNTRQDSFRPWRISWGPGNSTRVHPRGAGGGPAGPDSDNFVFDAQMLSQILYAGFRVGELTCPAKYFPEASSINFPRSVKYGLGCLATAVQFRLSKWGLSLIHISEPTRLGMISY